jgi:O-antigen ligase
MVSLSSFREQPLGTALSGLVAAIWEYRPSVNFSACAVTLVGALLLGGGTRGGFLSDAILELIAIPVILIALSSLVDRLASGTEIKPATYWALALCFAIALLPLIQLVPLPPRIWTNLPGHEELVHALDFSGRQLSWMPISVSPNSTWLSFLSLLPPLTIFLLGMQLTYRERRRLSLIVIAVGIVSVFVGLTQVAQGPSSPLRFFAFTNSNEAVGFFANRNHFAALLYAVLLFTAAWASDIGLKFGSWTDLRNVERFSIVAITAIFMDLIVLIAGEAMSRSRAGLALTIVALLAAFALGFTDRRRAPGATPSKLLIAAIILAVILSVQFALYRVLDRFGPDVLEDARITFAHNTIQAAKAFLPFGSGLGTFVPVYAMFEKPIDAFPGVYANHAHDDFLELGLETGVMGLLLFCLFAIWMGSRCVEVWRRNPADDATALDSTLARAASVVVLLLMAHSFVDYPLRTEAIMAVFAISCAFLIEPLRGTEEDVTIPAAQGRRREVRTPLARRVASSSSSASPTIPERETDVAPAGPLRQGGGRWGEEIDWPEEWLNSGERKRGESGKVEPE